MEPSALINRSVLVAGSLLCSICSLPYSCLVPVLHPSHPYPLLPHPLLPFLISHIPQEAELSGEPLAAALETLSGFCLRGVSPCLGRELVWAGGPGLLPSQPGPNGHFLLPLPSLPPHCSGHWVWLLAPLSLSEPRSLSVSLSLFPDAQIFSFSPHPQSLFLPCPVGLKHPPLLPTSISPCPPPCPSGGPGSQVCLCQREEER